jgi:PIN domain nuclease of toxin-antitoxin system
LRLLADTHVLLSLLKTGAPLPAPHRELLAGHKHVFTSAVSLWEIAIKWRLGKLQLGEPLEELPVAVTNIGCHILPVTAEHVLAEVDPWPDTQDPFDRLLLAICQVGDLRLVTLDRALRDHPLAWKPPSA